MLGHQNAGQTENPRRKGKHQNKALESSLPAVDWLWCPAGTPAVFGDKASQLFCPTGYKSDEAFTLQLSEMPSEA